MKTKMCILPIQCKMCKGVFDLWYDLQQQGINGEEFLQSQQNMEGVRIENFCWRCRGIVGEQAKLQEYQEYKDKGLYVDNCSLSINIKTPCQLPIDKS